MEQSDIKVKEELLHPYYEPNTIFLIEDHVDVSKLFNCMSKNAPEMYTCNRCGFKAYLKVNLKVHMELVHKSEMEVTLENFYSFSETNFNLSNILKCYNCCNCDFRTFSSLVLLKHALEHPESSINPETRRQYGNIKPRCTNYTYPIQKKTEWFECLECPLKSKCKYHLQKHILLKHTPAGDIEWFNCEQCSFKTQYKANLKKHKLIKHTAPRDIKWLKCNFCPYKAKQKSQVETHVISKHTANDSIKWFNCDHCTYRAKVKSTLKGHVLAKHTAPENITWNQCQLCAYKCKRKAQLKRHIQGVHTPPKDINWIHCEFCSYRCKRNTNLKQHLRCKHKLEL
ncbi:hypothetical protein BDFB_004714 [Asbolus verrucosus]|uniref:C2H2-type domain-containing protein n=1 Tax=Asbolus verrucosus TaxID=1661398 RepID=A0A482V1K6_ASBVE|nr:hypothetical protein BDFB_004714 [Asbolus verrucosus]